MTPQIKLLVSLSLISQELSSKVRRIEVPACMGILPKMLSLALTLVCVTIQSPHPHLRMGGGCQG